MFVRLYESSITAFASLKKSLNASTGGHISRLEGSECIFGQRCTLDPTGAAYDARRPPSQTRRGSLSPRPSCAGRVGSTFRFTFQRCLHVLLSSLGGQFVWLNGRFLSRVSSVLLIALSHCDPCSGIACTLAVVHMCFVCALC